MQLLFLFLQITSAQERVDDFDGSGNISTHLPPITPDPYNPDFTDHLYETIDVLATFLALFCAGAFMAL